MGSLHRRAHSVGNFLAGRMMKEKIGAHSIALRRIKELN